MKGVAILLLLANACCPAYAQELRKDLDSLRGILTTLHASDTTAINLRNDYIKQALFANPSDSTLMDFAQETLLLARETGYHKGELLAHERLALIYQYARSNPYKALSHYQQALTIVEADETVTAYKWGILGGIATIYYEQEEYRKALDYFNDVLLHSKALELTATANIANVYGAMGNVDSAIYYYQKALASRQLDGNPTYKANLYSNLSLMFEKTGDADAAVSSAEESLALINRHGIEFVRPTAYANAAMAYLSAGEHDKAERYARQSLEWSESQGNLFLQKSAWGTLADVWAAKGDYRRALDAHIRYAMLKDSLNNQNRRVEISRKQQAFEFEKERAFTHAEIERQATAKKTYLLAAGALLLASVFGFMLYKRRRDALAQAKEAEFRAHVSDTELKALRAQMNPHFIFNSLNSIGDYMLKNDIAAAQAYLTRFAKLMRMALENSEHREIPLSEDLEFMALYLQVEAKRLPGRFTYTINVADGLDPENILVPPLMLQPFVENSIWHGFKTNDSQGHIQITISRDKDMLVCRVDDNGIGRQQTNGSTAGKSFGIVLAESRIAILNRKKKANGKLHIIDKPHNSGTRVEITLPFQTAF